MKTSCTEEAGDLVHSSVVGNILFGDVHFTNNKRQHHKHKKKHDDPITQPHEQDKRRVQTDFGPA